MNKIALLYQANLPPSKNGIQKPMKPGGYSDSGADIANALLKDNHKLITPVNNPSIDNDKDWVFPDTLEGIKTALNKGADTLWLNTVLYAGHPIESFFKEDIYLIGQFPKSVDIYDDKFYTNELLKSKGIPIPDTTLIGKSDWDKSSKKYSFPLVLKPLRGRGSQGVSMVENQEAMSRKLDSFFASNQYGNSIYVEKYLSGQEITITVMPPGKYVIQNRQKNFSKPWCLPAVKRFNHNNGIAPYNGVVAVIENSAVLSDEELNSPAIYTACNHCIRAAELINIKAPIRIDCRADQTGAYFLFDLNMKPNMTGPSRPSRKKQDSLTLMAARKIGWDYIDLLNNMLNQKWAVPQ